MNQKRVLYEDEDIIVCHKAAGIATQTSRVGQADMVSEAANYLSRTIKGNTGRQSDGMAHSGKDGGAKKAGTVPYIGVVHRLDQPVEGILVMAKNQKAAANLSRQIAEEQTEKYYYAVVCGQDFLKEGDLEDYLLKDGRTNMSCIVPPERKGAKRALLHYEILAEQTIKVEAGEEEQAAHDEASGICSIALARIRLYTGRHHQIRVQMSHAGMGLLGDYKYADAQTIQVSKQMQIKEVALCAYRLSFMHPASGEGMTFLIRPEGKAFQKKEFLEKLTVAANRIKV